MRAKGRTELYAAEASGFVGEERMRVRALPCWPAELSKWDKKSVEGAGVKRRL